MEVLKANKPSAICQQLQQQLTLVMKIEAVVPLFFFVAPMLLTSIDVGFGVNFGRISTGLLGIAASVRLFVVSQRYNGSNDNKVIKVLDIGTGKQTKARKRKDVRDVWLSYDNSELAYGATSNESYKSFPPKALASEQAMSSRKTENSVKLLNVRLPRPCRLDIGTGKQTKATKPKDVRDVWLSYDNSQPTCSATANNSYKSSSPKPSASKQAMSSRKTIFLIALFLGLALAEGVQLKEHVCPKNEIWMEKGICESLCEDPRRVCSDEGKPPGCYCPISLGFVRDIKGDCIHYLECKNHCGENEDWVECGTCERTCENPNPICTKECKPARCMCKKGYVRHWATGYCIPETACKPWEPCGEHAHWFDVPDGICIPPCPGNCRNVRGEPTHCYTVCAHRFCTCDAGYAFDDKGVCIPELDCLREQPFNN
uniref:TIL domain-containing protein n=1 Tax=Steinernema glaseri TaxID=37863 RepID=A0A1I7ZN63_9BILA